MTKKTIVVFAGDGVGPEVVAEAVKVLKLIAERRGKSRNIELEFKEELIGLSAMEKTGKS